MFKVFPFLLCILVIVHTDKCPASPPCTCQYNIIYCDHLNLTDIPTFSKPIYNTTWDVELHSNKIKHIHNGAFKNLKLEMLLLFENEIEVIENDAFSGSEDTLSVLHLYSNKLTSLPLAVGKLKKLSGLDIHKNPMPNISEKVLKGVSSNLFSFMFGDEKMMMWPPVLKLVNNLYSLTVENMNIDQIPEDAFESHPALGSFEMISTNIRNIPCSLGNCSNLTDINFVDNPLLKTDAFKPDCFDGSKVTSMSIRNNSLTGLPPIFTKFRSLYTLQVENNPISSINDGVFLKDFSPNFWYMTLINTSLTNVPKTLSNLTTLTRLEFRVNQIRSIQERDFQSMSKLQMMAFTDNHLKNVSDDAFKGLISLTSLTLDRTNLITVPKAVSNLPSLKQLSLEDSKIVCNCDNFHWLKTWDRRSEVEIYGMCFNRYMTIALYISKELPNC